MPPIAQFTELISSFRCVEAQLQEAVRADDQTRVHARLLQRSAWLLDRIETFQPTCREELEEIFDHYARRRIECAAIGSRSAGRLADLLRRVAGSSLPSRDYPILRRTTLPDPLPQRIEAEDLASLVVHCDERLSAIGADNRFIAVSGAEAAFYGMRPSQMLGRHFHEIVGCGAAQATERRGLTLALAGRPWTVSLPRPGPVRYSGVVDGSGHLYAAIRHAASAA